MHNYLFYNNNLWRLRNRSYFTMLEMLIAMALTVLALSTLLFFYQEMIVLNNRADVMEKESFKLRYIESKLSSLFPQATSRKNKKDFFFFTSQDQGGLFASGSPKSLIFTYDHGVDLSKSFSNIVLGQMYLDGRQRVCLAYWPAPSRWIDGVNIPMKFEVLLENVDSLKFWFFVAPKKNWKEDSSNNQTPLPTPPPNPPSNAQPEIVVEPSPEGSWIDYWNQDFKQLPALVKIEIKRNGKTDFFAFPLSHSSRQPVYNQ